jgi:hypothetical protein
MGVIGTNSTYVCASETLVLNANRQKVIAQAYGVPAIAAFRPTVPLSTRERKAAFAIMPARLETVEFGCRQTEISTTAGRSHGRWQAIT